MGLINTKIEPNKQKMDNQQYEKTKVFQTGHTDPLYPVERTEEYWNDLLVEALGPNSHDDMPWIPLF